MPKHEMSRDPEAIAARLKKTQGKALVLALDLGTSTGYAATWYKPGDPVDPTKLEVIAGQVDLSAGAYESGAIRFLRLRHFLSAVKPNLLVFEHVRNTPAGASGITKYNAAAILARAMTSAQLFGAFQGVMTGWAEEFGVPCTGVPIGQIKKRATNRGNASKEQMIEAANTAFGLELDPEGYETTGVDNICDAAWALVVALEQYGLGLTIPETDAVDC